MELAAGYQHFADGAPFAEIALRHPSVKEVYFPWVDEPSGRPKLGFEEEDDKDEEEDKHEDFKENEKSKKKSKGIKE